MSFWRRVLKESAPGFAVAVLTFLRGLLQGKSAKEEAKELGDDVLETAGEAIKRASDGPTS